MDLIEASPNTDEYLVPCCPNCDYSGIFKRKRQGQWVCKKCGWAGKVPKRKVSNKYRNIPKALKPLLAVQREKRKNLGAKS
jgi:ribosomal protein L37AE/L43A